MTPEELAAGCYRVRKAFNSNRNILARFPGVRLGRTTFRKAGLFVAANVISRRELYRKYGKALGDPSPANELPLAPDSRVPCG